MTVSQSGASHSIKPSIRNGANEDMPIALPEPELSLDQDAEWCVVEVAGEWRRVRFHDYDEIYKVPGLYERIFYEVLKCQSPTVIRDLLERELSEAGTDPASLSVLDLGAGNGMMGEQLASLKAKRIVGIDIIPEAAQAAKRDRPGVYEDYLVADFTDLDDQRRKYLASFKFNALTCIAALGFGDIPPLAFTTAYNLIANGGWLAFNIKEDFLDDRDDDTGFSRLIRHSARTGVLTIRKQQRYQHRIATNGDPLFYVAVIAQKNQDIVDNPLM